MRTPVHTGQFRRDTRRAKRRGKDMAKLRDVLHTNENVTDPMP